MADWLHERPLRWMAIVVFGSRFAAAAVIYPAAMIMTPLVLVAIASRCSTARGQPRVLAAVRRVHLGAARYK
jgi:hypothetical protein